MKVPSWKELVRARAERVKSGYTSIRATKSTLEQLKEIQRKYPTLGLEEIIVGLIEMERERELRPGRHNDGR